MSELPILSGPSQEPASGGQPKQLVIMVHGLGADGNDLIGLAPIFAKTLPDARFVSPDAPYRFDMAPMGYQWFSIADSDDANMLAGVQAAAPILDAFIDAQLAAAGLGEENLALLGFSQGTMMSLHVGLRREKRLAGILAFSGRLIGADLLAGELKTRPPVEMYHGDLDPLIPHVAMDEAAAGLKAAGVEVNTHLCRGLPHGINEEGVVGGGKFLARIFNRENG